MELQAIQWVAIALCGLLIGLNKSGLFGAAMIAVTLMVGIFGGKASTGVILPMLIAGDVVAVIYYRRHADWRLVLRLLPWTLVGLAAGVVIGDAVSDTLFRRLIAVVVLASLGLLAYREFAGSEFSIPKRWWTAAILGGLAGFATMVGNAAGPIMTLYLLSMGMKKNEFIGTAAWFFFTVNVIKVPLHIIVWETITPQTLLVDALAIPVIVGGALLGLTIVRRISERPYRLFILAITTIIAVRLFF